MVGIPQIQVCCTIFPSTQNPLPPKKHQDIISTAQLPVSSVRDAVILLQQPGSGAGRTLDVEELREIVAELIAAYSEPDLQRSWDPVVDDKSRWDNIMVRGRHGP